MLADGVGGVEIDEPEQPVVADAGEQVGDLRPLAGGRHGPRLGDKYRVEGELPDIGDGGANKGANFQDGLR